MKYSLFHNDEKITKLRTKEFPVIYFVYDEMKDKGNKLYKKRKYRESIDYYVYAYSMLRWIEFKDPNKQKEFIATPNLDPILDNDIKECKAFLDDVAVEEESYNASIVFLLMCLSNSYMELRHYSEAIDCLDECIGIAQDKVADLYFRRSQARTYNKLSTEEDLKIAKADIEKAISLNSKEQMYQEHFEKLKKISEEKKVKTIEKIERKLNYKLRINKESKSIFG
jgi:tetratricopeptide (TPR) repeat protein